jgi:hypothetical protein
MRQETADAILAQLDQHGWGQGQAVSGDGKICLSHALTLAYTAQNIGNVRVVWDELCDKARALFPSQIGKGDAITFNDDPQTSEEDVRLLIKQCVEDT